MADGDTYSGTTPRPWGIGQKPTATQLATWLAICTHNERMAIAASYILLTREATECFEKNHVGHIAHLHALLAARAPVWQLPSGEQTVMVMAP